jgi:hypothetical protein
METMALAQYESLAVVDHPGERTNIGWLESILQDMDAAPTLMRAVQEVLAKYPQLKKGTLLRKYYAWKSSGMAALADRRRLRRLGKQNAWLECYMTYVERHNRSNAGAWRAMMDDFWAGKALPHGIGTWRDVWRVERKNEAVPAQIPPEWVPKSARYPNLQRAAKENPHYQFQIAASRKGRKAAHEFLLPVLRTRVGLEVGQVNQYDDVSVDCEILMPGIGKVARPQMFVGYDLASGMAIARAQRPQYPDADGKKRSSLKEKEFRMMLAWKFTCVGIHPNGSTEVVEWGTTAVRPALESRIKKIPVWGNLIRFERSGILAEAVHVGMFKGDGGGNFRFKAYCEGAHRLAHIARGMLPGQIGQDADHRPESHTALVRYDQRIMDAVLALPEEKRDLVRYNLCDWKTFAQLNEILMDKAMDSRTHEMEGWGDRTVTVWRLSEQDPWHTAGELYDIAGDQRDAILAWLQAHPEHRGVQKMTKREVWTAGARKLIRVPIFELPMLLDETDARRVRVLKNGTFGFQDAFYYGPDDVIFHATCVTRQKFQHALVPDREYLIFDTPYHTDGCVVVDPESGKTIGMAPAYRRAPVLDRQAIEAAMGAQNADLARKMMPIRGRHQAEAEARMALIGHNAEVLRGEGEGRPQISQIERETGGETEDAIERAAAEYREGALVEV